jgi:peptide deformylase
MAVRDILLYPEQQAALRKKSDRVWKLNRNVRQLIGDLKDTLLAQPCGIGLAAPQVNDHRRVVIVRLGAKNEEDDEAGPPIALINPIIVESRDERQDFDGCLSFSGLYGQTIRPHYLRVTGTDETGQPFDWVFEGFDAVVVHHEIDHLDGVLFIDRVRWVEDLYRVRPDAAGRLVRVSVSQIMLEDRIAVR